MKGSMEEMLYFVAIMLVIFFLFVFFTYQTGTRGAEVKKSIEERLLSEEISNAVFSLLNNKLPIAEKTYLETGIDAILQGISSKNELDKVFYGIGIGVVNVTETIPPLLENHVKGRWELTIITPDGMYVYGGVEKRKVIYSYEALIPVPEERVGKLIFLVTL